jgi:Type II secretion system (T2SS), protein F
MLDQKLSLQQQLMLCQQIALLTRTNLPLEHQLSQIAGQSKGNLAEAARHVGARLESGVPLVDSLVSDGDSSANRTLAACIQAGQSSNQLDQSLERWTSMHLSNSRSTKRFTSAMVYPFLLIVIMFVSIGLSAWTLIPEIRDTYLLFNQGLPGWLKLIVQLRENFYVVLIVMALLTLVPLAIWSYRRRGLDNSGIPKSLEKRLRLQALATRLASLQLSASRPLSEIVPLCLSAVGAEKKRSEHSFQDLQARRPLDPLPAETSMLLGALHGGMVERDRAVELLNTISDQLDYRAELKSLRDARWIPMLIAIIVFLVTMAAYATLVYLPWIQLMYKIGHQES